MPATARRSPASSIVCSPSRPRRLQADRILGTSNSRLRIELDPALEFLRQQALDLLRPLAVGLELSGILHARPIVVGPTHARRERVLLRFERLDFLR